MAKESKAWGIASLVTGIIGVLIFFMPYFGLFLSVFAIISASIQKKKHGSNGVSTAGLILGIIGTILNLIAILMFGTVLFLAAKSS